MRYGVVRSSPELPPLSVQRRLIETVGADIILQEGDPQASSHRSLITLLLGLNRGDELVVHGLDSLDATTGELACLLRHFLEVGVTLTMVGGSRAEVLTPGGAVPRVLALLADHETRRSAQDNGPRRARASDALLTQHQLKFARDMQRRGHSMRAIGLLFRLAPNEVARLLRTARDDDGSGPEPDEADFSIRISPTA